MERQIYINFCASVKRVSPFYVWIIYVVHGARHAACSYAILVTRYTNTSESISRGYFDPCLFPVEPFLFNSAFIVTVPLIHLNAERPSPFPRNSLSGQKIRQSIFANRPCPLASILYDTMFHEPRAIIVAANAFIGKELQTRI